MCYNSTPWKGYWNPFCSSCAVRSQKQPVRSSKAINTTSDVMRNEYLSWREDIWRRDELERCFHRAFVFPNTEDWAKCYGPAWYYVVFGLYKYIGHIFIGARWKEAAKVLKVLKTCAVATTITTPSLTAVYEWSLVVWVELNEKRSAPSRDVSSVGHWMDGSKLVPQEVTLCQSADHWIEDAELFASHTHHQEDTLLLSWLDSFSDLLRF